MQLAELIHGPGFALRGVVLLATVGAALILLLEE